MPTHKQTAYNRVREGALLALKADSFPPSVTVVPADSDSATLVCTSPDGTLKYKEFPGSSDPAVIEDYIIYWLQHGELLEDDFYEVTDVHATTSLTDAQKRAVYQIKTNQRIRRLYSRANLPPRVWLGRPTCACNYIIRRSGPPLDRSLIVDCTK